MQEYRDKSITELQEYSDKSINGLQWYEDKNVGNIWCLFQLKSTCQEDFMNDVMVRLLWVHYGLHEIGENERQKRKGEYDLSHEIDHYLIAPKISW